MLKIFFAFVKKETFHILRDTRTLVILFGMPIMLVFIFGYTVTNEFKDASIAIIDQSKDELSKSLAGHLVSSGNFLLVDNLQTVAELEDAFKAGTIKMGVVIPAQFEQQFYRDKEVKIQLIADATEPNYAATLVNYANNMIKAFQKEWGSGGNTPYQVDIETRMYYNPKLVGAYNFIPGVVALILMLICAMMTSLTIAKEKELGTMDLLLVSPLPPLMIILGKVTPYIVLSFSSALMIFALGVYVFEVPILGSIALLLALSLLYLMVALALGVLISTKAENQQAAMMTSMFSLLMPTMLLSGFLFPIESMPTVLQYISEVIPAKYFIDIEKAIMLKGAGWSFIAQPTFILVIMTFVLFAAAWKNFKVIYE
ncbi:MAG: ABC transporter permease [Bacteroidota bacterium]